MSDAIENRSAVTSQPRKRTTLRQRILFFVSSLILLSLMGSTISVYRITEVSRLLDAINKVSVPLGRLLTQLESDAVVFRRELDRGLGYSHWSDPHWRPRPLPRWIDDVLTTEVERVNTLVQADSNWADAQDRVRWQQWAKQVSERLTALRGDTARLYTALDQKDEAQATQLYAGWSASLEEWMHQLQWGIREYDRSLRQTFSLAQARASELRTGLEMILVVVVALSLLLLWLGERALRPLSELTKLAREITRRGLRKEDKSALTQIPVSRSDEISQLAREFHHMATSLLEREKVVEAQKQRLIEQNHLLVDMGALNANILHSIKSALVVTDLQGKITQCNPVAVEWFECKPESVLGSGVQSWPKLGAFTDAFAEIAQGKPVKIEPRELDGRILGGHLIPLKDETGASNGAILVLEDLTEELGLQERLRVAENLAAVGRMSAQVAHEVRNPLHSLGLEAEMALDVAAKLGNPVLKQSLTSILSAVDRLDKITENYLKLSRLSAGEKRRVDLGEVLENVLATYAPLCEAQGVRVDWKREPRSDLTVRGDGDLLEQVFGNLLKNAIQALEGAERPKVSWSMGNTDSGRVWIRIEDNGPGVAAEIRGKLFTPFFTTRAQGTGLGLSFIKKVVDDHEGAIACLDRTGGAAFEVLLPGFDAALPESASEPISEPIQEVTT